MKKLIFCIVFITTVNGQDECPSAKSFPDINKRSPTYALKAGETPISDRYIEEGWYGELGIELHSGNSPGLEKCGTVYPVYLKDNVTESGNEQDVDVCIHANNECDYPFTIKMKRCEFITVYYLERLLLASAGYCAGLPGNKSDSPDYKTENIDVKVEVDEDNNFLFYCDFKQSADILWYTVFWYVDDRVIAKSKTIKGQSTDVRSQTLLEEQLIIAQGVTSVGFKVKCAVRASFENGGPLCLPSISKAKFIGFEILTPLITIGPNQNDSIRLRPTAPICHSNVAHCQLNVEINYPIEDACNPRAMFEHTNCKLVVGGTDWDQVFEMKVKLSPPQIYVDRSYIHYIKLRTTDVFQPHSIWGNSSIGDIQIHLKPDTRPIQSKMCYAVADPHMQTFEHSNYEHMYDGVFTLYENKEWQQEVQFKTEPCSRISRAYCSCAVAIRAGREVFIMDHCGNKSKFDIKYALCDDRKQLLDVEKKDKLYMITLPSSTVLKMTLLWNIIDVHITPSYADVNSSRGLCGNVNDYKFNPMANERFLRNGKASVDDGEFSRSWEVTGSITDLFSDDLDNLTSLIYQDFYCNCNPSGDTNDVTCSNNCSAAVRNYTRTRECTIKDIKRKRSVDNALKESGPRREVRHRIVRSAEDGWRNGWIEEKARSYCTELFKNSSALQICKDIPTVDLDGPMNNCIADIKYIGDTRFSPIAVESVKTQCYHEVEFNTTLQEEKEPGKPSVFNQVKLVACPYECSNKGNCVGGICKCEVNYGGIDCSVNISDPPVMEYLSEDGYCDLSDDECSEVSVFGGIFVETENTSCKINYIQITEDNTVQDVEETIHRPDVESISEAICFLPKHRNRRETEKPEIEFVKVYKISVANNGIAYSDESVMVIFNSRCQYCTINGLDVKCSFTGDFCMSGGVCYENGEPHASYKCYVCSVNNGSRSWNYSTAAECQIVKEEDEKPGKEHALWIVGVVLGIVVLLCVSLLALWFIINKSKGRTTAPPHGSKTDM